MLSFGDLTAGFTDNSNVSVLPLPNGTAITMTEAVAGTYEV